MRISTGTEFFEIIKLYFNCFSAPVLNEVEGQAAISMFFLFIGDVLLTNAFVLTQSPWLRNHPHDCRVLYEQSDNLLKNKAMLHV